ncbi:MAG: NAD(P)-dependent alcohol dehydrogenase [Methanobacteriota archaeon]|nr:MAG: NAD(P)-dependent alcohol dehydrogenase [Euryarchaeota archaeon]
MKAIVCTKYGPPDVLQLKEVDKPSPKPNEVLIKIHTSTVTTGDCRIRSFTFASWFWLPGRIMFGITKPRKEIPGWELSGEIESTGKNVTQFKKGDKVFGYSKGVSFGGTNAEYKCLSQDRIVTIDLSRISYEDAAVLPVGGLTALYLLRKANVEVGQKVLIYGASGSVGTYAVQLSKYYGAEVTGVCSSRNFELVKSLGADTVIDYTKEDFTKNGLTYDVIFDAVSKISFHRCKDSLQKNGAYLTVDWPFLQRVWTSITSEKRILFGMSTDSNEDLIFLKELVEKGKLKPVIDRSYPLEEAVEAYRYVDQGHKKGNVIITVGDSEEPT